MSHETSIKYILAKLSKCSARDIKIIEKDIEIKEGAHEGELFCKYKNKEKVLFSNLKRPFTTAQFHSYLNQQLCCY